MSTVDPFTQVALPVTLRDLLEARDKALALHRQARRTNELAHEELRGFGRSGLMPHSSTFRAEYIQVQSELDAAMWRRAFDMTGFSQLMDAAAVAEFERSLHPKPPEFTEGAIRSTFLELQQQADIMFRRGIVNVFRGLSGKYRTHKDQAFKIGSKVIMSYMVGPSFKKGLYIRHGRPSDQLNDVDRVLRTLAGEKFEPRRLESAMNAAFMEWRDYECGYYKAKAFKNGNLHLWFQRSDLVEKVNEQIAAYYGEGKLGGGRK